MLQILVSGMGDLHIIIKSETFQIEIVFVFGNSLRFISRAVYIQRESKSLKDLSPSFRHPLCSASPQTSSLVLTFPFGTVHKYFTLDSNEEGNESVSRATTGVKKEMKTRTGLN